jgi:hypothetical protein
MMLKRIHQLLTINSSLIWIVLLNCSSETESLKKKIIMKKFLIAAAMLVLSTGIFAQAKPKDPKTGKKPGTVKLDSTHAKSAAPTKKDGTADMRYKANKDAAKPAPAGPVKKDGTADMRYKANKKDTVKKKS